MEPFHADRQQLHQPRRRGPGSGCPSPARWSLCTAARWCCGASRARERRATVRLPWDRLIDRGETRWRDEGARPAAGRAFGGRATAGWSEGGDRQDVVAPAPPRSSAVSRDVGVLNHLVHRTADEIALRRHPEFEQKGQVRRCPATDARFRMRRDVRDGVALRPLRPAGEVPVDIEAAERPARRVALTAVGQGFRQIGAAVRRDRRPRPPRPRRLRRNSSAARPEAASASRRAARRRAPLFSRPAGSTVCRIGPRDPSMSASVIAV